MCRKLINTRQWDLPAQNLLPFLIWNICCLPSIIPIPGHPVKGSSCFQTGLLLAIAHPKVACSWRAVKQEGKRLRVLAIAQRSHGILRECHSLREEGKCLTTFREGGGMNEDPPVCCNSECLNKWGRLHTQ